MASKGVAGTSMSALVTASGLPASSIYWHFGSKDGVLAAVMERGAQRFFADLGPVESFPGTGVKRLRAQLDDTARALEEHPDFLHLLLTLLLLRDAGNDAAGEVIREVRRRGRERIEEAIAAAIGGRDARAARRAAKRVTNFALATIDGAFIAHHEEGSADLHELLEQLSRAVMALVRDARRG